MIDATEANLTDAQPDDYDSPWKAAIEQFFPEFMAFYFPAAHAQIDWAQTYIFLDQELQEVVKDAGLGKRFVDKLVRATGNDGAEDWLYIHLEVQGTAQAEFAKRMFVYNYRLFDRYNHPIASMAVLADDNPDWKPDKFGFDTLGCRLWMEFPIAKLTDHEHDMDSLLAHSNPFALVTAASLATRTTKGDPVARYEIKRKLVRLLYDKGWDKQQVIDLFAVIDWMMWLPEHLLQQLRQEIRRIEEVNTMRYVTSIEQLGRQEGWQEGIEQGIERGIEQGVHRGEAAMLHLMLMRRFGELSPGAETKIANASQEQLQRWAAQLFDASSLDDVLQDDLH